MNLIFIIITLEVKNAKKFLRKNLTKSRVVAARIFNVNVKTLTAFIKRESDAKNEDQNKVLQNHEKNALDDFIRLLLQHEISFTSEVVFNAIMRSKRSHRLKTSSKK
jgi:hypothetical protein